MTFYDDEEYEYIPEDEFMEDMTEDDFDYRAARDYEDDDWEFEDYDEPDF